MRNKKELKILVCAKDGHEMLEYVSGSGENERWCFGLAPFFRLWRLSLKKGPNPKHYPSIFSRDAAWPASFLCLILLFNVCWVQGELLWLYFPSNFPERWLIEWRVCFVCTGQPELSCTISPLLTCTFVAQGTAYHAHDLKASSRLSHSLQLIVIRLSPILHFISPFGCDCFCLV